MKQIFVSFTFFKEGNRERQYDNRVFAFDMEEEDWFYNLNKELERYKDYEDFVILNIVIL